MKRLFAAISLVAGLLLGGRADACTSVIVSGKARPDGRAIMFKHRDSKAVDNAVARFQGERYAFTGVVNAKWREKAEGRGTWPEVWGGINETGFCIMNTATYDLKDDNVPDKMMDREGLLMYRALEICSSVAEFEHFLDTLSRPRGVQTNFGVIDAYGGAAYFEVCNDFCFKYDVNDEPLGYRVVTNFTQHGDPQKRKGEDRYELARSLMPAGSSCGWNHSWLINTISRPESPILRHVRTVSVMIMEGVAPGEDPSNAVMWACVGYPTAAPLIPLKVWDRDLTPEWLQAVPSSEICDKALSIKPGRAISQCLEIEAMLDRRFRPGMSQGSYRRLMRRCYRLWKKSMLNLPE